MYGLWLYYSIELLKTIEMSIISIIIFSENYATKQVLTILKNVAPQDKRPLPSLKI